MSDLISRQAVIDEAFEVDTKEYGRIEVVGVDAINTLPSVKPQEIRTGHWIMSDDVFYRPICDKCGAHPWKGYIPTVEEVAEVFKYCPNCGARMSNGKAYPISENTVQGFKEFTELMFKRGQEESEDKVEDE